MGAEVYVDLYFLINMSMDLLCLLIAGRLLHRRMGVWRLLAASAAGGAYAVASLLWLGGAVGFAADLLFACVMCAISFWGRAEGFWRLLSATAVFALISMAMGGMMTAFYVLLNRLELPMDLLDTDTLSVYLFGLVALASALLTARGGRWMGVSQRSEWVRLDAVLLGRSVSLCAMVDTGNLLTDPISGRGVIAVERQRLARVLPRALTGEGRDAEAALFSYLRANPRAAARVRLIPAKTATGGGILVAILPDSLLITEGGRRYRADYLIGISSLGERAQGIDALMPRV